MHGSKEIIEEASVLPLEERAIIVDALLQTLNAPSALIDKHWIEVAEKRSEEIRLKKVKLINGEDVFSKIRDQFKK